MFDVKLLKLMIFILIASYCLLMILYQIPSFRDFCEKGGFVPFENILIGMALLYIFIGAYANGYVRGFKDGKTESNKTESK